MCCKFYACRKLWLTVAWVLWYIEIIVLHALVWYGHLRLSYKQ